jgi:Cu-Zn family superoxide dismutase
MGSPPTAAYASAQLFTSEGRPAGIAAIVQRGDTATLTVGALAMPVGVHGVHLHAVGRCDAPQFTTAGSHLNPGGRQHGTTNPAGSHLGDLPNLTIGASGTGSLRFRMADGGAALDGNLFDADGTAIVVHAGPDDYLTDPSGNSGGRIACGVFKRG